MIRTEQRGSARWIVLDRPDVRNALSAELIRRSSEALDEALRDDAVRSVVLTGAGKVFSAGADLNEMKGMRGASFEENVASAVPIFDFLTSVVRASKPVVARVNGPAVAGALGIVSACDVVVSVPDIAFAFTEVRIGLVPAMISPFVVRRLGAVTTQRLFLSGERFPVDDALRMGLVDRIVSAEVLDETIDAVTGDFDKCAPGALAEVKRLIGRVAEGPIESHRDATAELIARLRVSEEGQEGMASFLEKRKPRWTERS